MDTDPQQRAMQAYCLATLVSSKATVRRLEDVVIEVQDGLFAYLFAQNVKGCRKRLMQRVVIEDAMLSRNAKLLYVFARDIPGANRKLLGEHIKRLGDHGWIEAFRRLHT